MKEEKQAETLLKTMKNAFDGCKEAAERLEAFNREIEGTDKEEKCKKLQELVHEWVGKKVLQFACIGLIGGLSLIWKRP